MTPFSARIGDTFAEILYSARRHPNVVGSAVRRRQAVIAALFATALLLLVDDPAGAVEPDDGSTNSDGQAAAPHEIVFPVVGPVDYSDTWGACRGTRCSRSHKGADLFGTKLAPLVAADDGTIVGARRSGLTSAGNTVIIRADDGWRYLYLHVNNDSPGTDDGSNPQGWILANRLRIGDRVEAGQVIGYLGDSGNAESTPAHLHFEMHKPGVGAINPTASITAAENEGRVVAVAPLASTADGRAEHTPLIEAWYNALLHRPPSTAESFAWADRFDIGFATRDDLIADLTMSPQRTTPAGTVLRSYRVMFGRRPSLVELRLGEAMYRNGHRTPEIIDALLNGDEFAAGNGSPSDSAFIEVIYRNARGRAPSDSVRAYWLEQLAGGRPRAEMAAYFADSYGVKNNTWHELEVMQAFRAALDRGPTPEEYVRWVDHLDDGGLIVDIVDDIKD